MFFVNTKAKGIVYLFISKTSFPNFSTNLWTRITSSA